MKKWNLSVATVLLALVISTPLIAANAVNFKAHLSGDQEVPAVETDATGKIIIHINQALTLLRFKLDVFKADDLLSAAGAHFHCGVEGMNGPVIAFVAGSFAPGFDGHFQIRATLTDDSIIGVTACGTTIAELAMAMAEGNVYVNVHSLSHPGGEIRGQVE